MITTTKTATTQSIRPLTLYDQAKEAPCRDISARHLRAAVSEGEERKTCDWISSFSFFQERSCLRGEKDEILRSNGEFLNSRESSSVSGGENSIYDCFALCIMHAAPYLSVYYTWVWGSPYNHILIVTPPKGSRRILLSGFFPLRGYHPHPPPFLLPP